MEAAPAAAVGEQRPKNYGATTVEDRLELLERRARFAENRVELLENRAHLRNGCDRKRSAEMLFVGTVAGFLGFFIAFMIGSIRSYGYDTHDLNGKRFASGMGYFPSTVSEMVHKPSDPAGKCFFCFELLGAIVIFFSSYPTMLRNVYMGDDVLIPFINISWTTFRQFVPAPGMMVLTIITTVPAVQAEFLDKFCIQLHMIGALMLFIGYFLAEARAVGWGPFPEPACRALVESQGQTRELRVRNWCLHGVLFWWVTFCLLQALILIPVPFAPADHFDKWGKLKRMGGAQWEAKYWISSSKIQLIDTAHLDVKIVKVASYLSEVLCGMCMLASHFAVWYYCEERNYDLAEELPSLNDKKKSEQSPESKESLNPTGV